MYGWLPVCILEHWGGELLVHVRAVGHGRTNDQLVALIPVQRKEGRFFTVEYVTHLNNAGRGRGPSELCQMLCWARPSAPQGNRPEFYMPHGGAYKRSKPRAWRKFCPPHGG